jgi:hypothetical protein
MLELMFDFDGFGFVRIWNRYCVFPCVCYGSVEISSATAQVFFKFCCYGKYNRNCRHGGRMLEFLDLTLKLQVLKDSGSTLAKSRVNLKKVSLMVITVSAFYMNMYLSRNLFWYRVSTLKWALAVKKTKVKRKYK